MEACVFTATKPVGIACVYRCDVKRENIVVVDQLHSMPAHCFRAELTAYRRGNVQRDEYDVPYSVDITTV